MIPSPVLTVRGAFEWYGLRTTIHGNSFHMTKGRIGRTDRPLLVSEGQVKGGWYVAETTFCLTDDIERVDILMRDDKTYIMFRSDDPSETYPDEFDILLALAWKMDGEWYVATPEEEQ